jgi:hypothetical protein
MKFLFPRVACLRRYLQRREFPQKLDVGDRFEKAEVFHDSSLALQVCTLRL